jgi:hypothetical protein
MAHFVQNSIGLLAPLTRQVAYLDPGTGSFLLQLLLATLLGSLFLVRTFWSRIKGFFGRVFSKNKGEPQPPAVESPAGESQDDETQ